MALFQTLKMKQRHNNFREWAELDGYDDQDLLHSSDDELREISEAEFYGDSVHAIMQGPYLRREPSRYGQWGSISAASSRTADIARPPKLPEGDLGPTLGDTTFDPTAAQDMIDKKWRRSTASVFEIPTKVFLSDAFRSLAAEEQTPVDFLTLVPAEIRNAIYSALLESRSPLRITTRHGRHMLASADVPDSPKAVFILKRLAILEVSKQVAKEALPILYSKTTFAFDKITTMMSFLSKVGDNAQSLKNIVVFGKEPWNITGAVPALGGLSLATNLTSLTLDHRGLYAHALSGGSKINVGDLAEQLKVFLQAWRGAAKEKSKSQSVLDVIKVVEFPTCECGEKLEDCEDDRCGKQQKKVDEAHLDKVSKGLCSAIAKKMGIKG